MTALRRYVSRVRIVGWGYCVPPKNAQDEIVPEQVENLQQQNRREYLPLHPPNHPHSVIGRPSLARLGHQVELRVDAPEHNEIEPMPEIRPYAEEDDEGDDLGAFEAEIVENLGKGEEGVGDVHGGIDGIAD